MPTLKLVCYAPQSGRRHKPRSGWAFLCLHYRLVPLEARSLSPPFDSGGLASVFDFDPFAHVLAYGDPNRLGLLMSSNGIGLAPYLNRTMHGHVRLPAQSCRTIAVGNRIGTGRVKTRPPALSAPAGAEGATGIPRKLPTRTTRARRPVAGLLFALR